MCFPSAHHNYLIIWLNFCYFFLGFQSIFLWRNSFLAVTAASLWQSPLRGNVPISSPVEGHHHWGHSPSVPIHLGHLVKSVEVEHRGLPTSMGGRTSFNGVLPIKAADGFVSVTHLISWADMAVKPAFSRFVVFSKWNIIDKFWFSPWGGEILSITQNPIKTFREVFSRTQLRFKKLLESSEPSGS